MRGKDFFIVYIPPNKRITPAYAGKSCLHCHFLCHAEDHPRLCGEKCAPATTMCKRQGSPPPMRGKDDDLNEIDYWDGITPAYAGKRSKLMLLAVLRRDHPRLCGEKYRNAPILLLFLGSPPPMRGKVSAISWAYKSGGITPAYAGKSAPKIGKKTGIRDHPRLCGEKRRTIIRNTIPKGSPPPMRGKGCGQLHSLPVVGITPAYAGKRCKNVAVQSPKQDHPRLCGEKESRLTELKKYPGSPPPMRGKVSRYDGKYNFYRITPAYAGKRSAWFLRSPLKRDHPRLCGEKRKFPMCPAILQGSPPPMRGKEAMQHLIKLVKGITPAYAGKSYDRHWQCSAGGDHPRLCGEKLLLCRQSRPLWGSPPPMRGKEHRKISRTY